MFNQTVALPGFSLTIFQLLMGIALAALLAGWLLGWLLNRPRPGGKTENRAADKERLVSNAAFMKGINYILTDKPDLAIEELTRAVTLDSETVETYVALGNLFRSKGEIDRAVRIRQSIILRPNLDEKVRRQALFDLGLDYRRGGLLDRAVKTFEDVIKADSTWVEAYQQLVRIYEDVRDWDKAFETQQKLAKLTGAPSRGVMAHHQVELGKVHFEKGRLPQAQAAYKKALSLDPSCVDAYLHLGDMHLHEGKPKKAVEVWRKIASASPEMTFLAFGRLTRVAAVLKDLRPVEEFLAQCAAGDQSALARLVQGRLSAQRGRIDEALAELGRAVDMDPDLYEARREIGLILLTRGRDAEALQAYRDLLDHLTVPDAEFQCGRCGLVSPELQWRCPQCCAWDSMSLHRRHPLLLDREEIPGQRQDESPSESCAGIETEEVRN